MILNQESIKRMKSILPVNDQILIFPGNRIWARNAPGNLIMVMEVNDSFEDEMAIYEFGSFVRMLASFKGDVTIDQSAPGYVTMSNDKRTIKYRLSDRDLIRNVLTQPKDLTNPQYYFKMSQDQMSDMQMLATDTQASQLVFAEDGIHMINSKDRTSHSAHIKMDLKGYPGKTTIKLDQSPINLIPGDYDVALQTKQGGGTVNAMKFTHQTEPMYLLVGAFHEE